MRKKMRAGDGRFIAQLLFFLAGFTGLVYEMLWIRMSTSIFGVHFLAITAVVATFMAGQALGSLAVGILADRDPG